MSDIALLKDIYKTLDVASFSWLHGRNFSDSFIICIGAGPWKFKRRQKIQKQALDFLNGRDLSQITEDVNWYPLKWQNQFLNNIRTSIKNMEQFCKELILYSNSYGFKPGRVLLYEKAGCPKGSKVLSLFCRDALKIPSFPIDRHVKRFLLENGLPAKEKDIIELCELANLDPCKVAVGIVRKASNMDNPDWSK